MSGYMPSTEDVRDAWWRDQCPPNDIDMDDIYNAGFDRWLAERDAEMAARAAVKALEDAAQYIEVKLVVEVTAEGRPIKVLKEGTTDTAREWLWNRAAELSEGMR